MSDFPDRHERRNFLLNVAEGALWVAGASFMSAQTVLPALITRLGGGNIGVGAVGVILWVGLFLPQIFAARYSQALPWKKPWAIGFGAAQRVVVLLIAIVIIVWGESSPGAALVLFLVLYTANQVILGITTPGWFDLLAKLTPLKKRGRLTGIRNSIAGCLAFLCGLLLTWLLSSQQFPLSYGIAFLCAFLLQAASIVVQTRLVEEQPSPALPRLPVGDYLSRLPRVFDENPEFKAFIGTSVVLIVASMPVSFFTIYALDRFQADESAVGQFTLAIVAAQVVSALANGFVADRFGNRIVLICAAIAMLCASAAALLAPSLAWFMVVFLFVGINLGSELMARYNIAIEYGPVEQRSTYIGLMNTILAPFYLAGLLGGLISNAFGYHTLFIIGIAASLVGTGLLVWRVRDPRTFHH